MSLGEIRLQAEVSYLDSAVGLSKQVLHIPRMLVTRNTRLMAEGIPLISTTALGDTIPLGMVTNAGLASFVNMDVDNYIELGSIVAGVFVPDIQLDANDGTGIPYAVFPMAAGKVWKARANTSAAYLQFSIFQRG